VTAIRAGYKAFTDPESVALDLTREARIDLYTQAWAYYRSTIFSKRTGDSWTTYLSDRGMYKHTRLIFNPIPQTVDFYVDNIWHPPANEDFESLVTPVADGTDEKLLDAIAQIDQWTSFRAEAQRIKRYCAATGNVLIEVIDSLDRGKILQRTIWPGYISSFEVNDAGDLQTYTLEYPAYDTEKKVTYQLKKVVTKESFSWFRDNTPFVPPGKPDGAKPVEENPYGFCPAVFIKHSDDGGGYGIPAFKDFDKVDEANALASHLHDNIHKTVESPVLISTGGEVKMLSGVTDAATLDLHDPRLDWMVLKSEAGASVLDMASKLKLAEAEPYLRALLASFQDDYPELQAATIIRENSQLSGAALERMLGPAQNRLNGVQPFYNQHLIKLRQMQLAIGGYRVRNGWSNLTDQQRKFGEFDLNSYEGGKLDFNLKPSVLVQNTEAENEDVLIKKADRAGKLKGIGVDQIEQWKAAGFSDDEIKDMQARLDAEKDDLGDMERRLGIANSSEGLLPLKEQLRLLKPGATPEELEAMAAEMTQTEPVRQARMLNA
jgi:hypothetical protein